jgi:Phytanoyl-CoA dioxygenase (PhyH)
MVRLQNQLHQDGCIILRNAIPTAWLDELRQVFDEGVRPSEQWPTPRGPDWRHSLLDLSPLVQAVCQLPPLLAAAGEVIGERFFLAQVEGREPLQGGGHQSLHRDLSAQRAGDTVMALAFLDNFGAENGATRIVPGSHRLPDLVLNDALPATQISGLAGDILVFDADLVHASCINITGARRRSLLLSYMAAPIYASHCETAALRGVRMETKWFSVNP